MYLVTVYNYDHGARIQRKELLPGTIVGATAEGRGVSGLFDLSEPGWECSIVVRTKHL